MDYIYLVWSNDWDGADVVCTTFDEDVANEIVEKVGDDYSVSRLPILSSSEDYKSLNIYFVEVNQNGIENRRIVHEQKSLLEHYYSTIDGVGNGCGWSTQSFEHAKELALEKLKEKK
jgi:hypothetical protein